MGSGDWLNGWREGGMDGVLGGRDGWVAGCMDGSTDRLNNCLISLRHKIVTVGLKAGGLWWQWALNTGFPVSVTKYYC